jgi:hypothetical protein
MINKFWTEFRHHDIQQQFWQQLKDILVDPNAIRRVAAAAGRGSGKTEMARRFTVLSLAIEKPWEPIYAFGLPTYAQAKKVAWGPLLSLIPETWLPKNGVNLSDMRIQTKFGSTLYVVGMDQPHRIEGLQLDGVVLDESCDQRPGIFDRTVRPMLLHRNAWALRIGVPKRHGIGRTEFKEFFDQGCKEGTGIKSFHWTSEEILNPELLAREREGMDAQDYEEQFRAAWIETGGGIYHAFSKDNISEEVKYLPEQTLLIGCDFNVNPMSWVLGHRVGRELHIFDEVFLRHTNTAATLNHVFNHYGSHSSGWEFVGDASARARNTKATVTDYIIIKNDTRFEPQETYFPAKNPRHHVRFSCVNWMLKNAKGDIRLKIHPRCKRLINDLKNVAYKEGTMEMEDYSATDLGHVVDALGYLVYRKFPMQMPNVSAPMVVTT